MADITTTITTFPPAPDSGTDSPTEFNSKADAFVNHQSGVYVGEVNQWATEANSLKTDMNTIKTEIDGIVATIPSGSINDSAIAIDSVWSSYKTNNEISNIEKIESGSDVNGNWTKFPDGTLICTGAYAVSYTTTDAIGAVFRNLSIPPWTYPLPPNTSFIDIPSLSVYIKGSNSWVASSSSGATTTQAYIAIYGAVSSATGKPSMTAIGRWK